ncbi:MAG: hydroxypyruvate isomerase [Rhodocyclaceae bacterium]|nr:hydroxypyruvate isomerase [Rhodocyclaceae bacterium]MBX3668047.1 hydroxypyruvate isomerase [Rhodocyclaceae bacterium]
MPNFSANLSFLFTERPFPERFEAARQAGFGAVEYMFPYAWDKSDLAARLRDAQLKQALFNLPAGDWEAGDRGIACNPARMEEFRAGVAQAIDYALALGCPQLNCLAGIAPADVPTQALYATMVANVQHAADECARAGLRLLIEPINTYDIPGFYLHRSGATMDLISDVNADNVFLQYDVYHMQRMEGDLADTMRRLLAKIGHVQIADVPGRHEPGSGEINYDFLLGYLDRLGYSGWVGCEYRPSGRSDDSLGWMARWRGAQ